jgi:regulator of RNase E activity RraA
VTPNGSYKNGPGEINVPVVIGGKVVHPGDIVTGDADGVIIVNPEDVDDLLKETHAIIDLEAMIMDEIRNRGTYTRPWVNEKMEELGYEL